MKAEEIKRRNIALATYMGLQSMAIEGKERVFRNLPTGFVLWTDNPPFHRDMNLLMSAVWRLLESGVQIEVLKQKVTGKYLCIVDADEWPDFQAVLAADSPALALFEAVSSLVMEIQGQQK